MKCKIPQVEGPWEQSGYTFKTAGPSEYPIISQFLSKYYYRDEPITVFLGYSDAKAKDMDDVVKQFLEDSLSIYAIHDQSGEVAAVRIAYDSRRKMNLTSTYKSRDNLKVQIAKDTLLRLGTEALSTRYSNPIYAMGFLSSVATTHRGKYLASEIYVRSLLQFKERGFTLTRNFFSSKVTMKIVSRLGYEELSRVYMGQLRDEDGELVFEGADPDFYCVFMAKSLMIDVDDRCKNGDSKCDNAN